VAPLGREPAVVVVEPADHGADVEGAVDGVEDVGRAGDARAVGDDGARDDGPEELGALAEPQALEPTPERVEKDPAGRVELGGGGEVSW
jgi:hypothetical protein